MSRAGLREMMARYYLGDQRNPATPLVVIVGRPNVGKSTLANRIAGGRKFIARGETGVTRDRSYQLVTRYRKHFTVVDTGGFIPDEHEALLAAVRAQAEVAINEADVIVLVTDGKAGLHPYDHELARLLRRIEKPVVLAVNKIDTPRDHPLAADFYRLGLAELFTTSAEHGLGVGDLMERLLAIIPEAPSVQPEESIRIALVGRPNVGKSCLINRILGYDRVIVNELPGTTRDPIDTWFKLAGQAFTLIDTAGVRRRPKIRLELEKETAGWALKSIRRCDLAFVVVDTIEPFTDQDLRLAGYALSQGKAVAMLINKWDLVDGVDVPPRQYLAQLQQKIRALARLPLLTVSALTGLRVMKSLRLAAELFKQYSKRASTHELNQALARAQTRHPPPAFGRRPVRLSYIAQTRIRPPTFLIFANHPQGIKESYRRYLVQQLGQALGLERVPIKLMFRKKYGQGTARG